MPAPMSTGSAEIGGRAMILCEAAAVLLSVYALTSGGQTIAASSGKVAGSDAVHLVGPAIDVVVSGAPLTVTMDDVTCTRCTVNTSAVIHQAVLRGTVFVDSQIERLSLTDSDLRDVEIRNSRVGHLTISRSRIAGLNLINTSVDTLVIDNSEIGTLTMWGLELTYALVSGGEGRRLVAWDLRGPGQLEVEGGSWDVVDIDRAAPANTTIALVGTVVDELRVSPKGIDFLDVRRIGNRPGTLILQQENEAMTFPPGAPRRARLLLEAQLVYGQFSQQFGEAGLARHQREMEYRMRLMELRSVDDDLERALLTFWQQHVRGSFGLSPLHILWDALLAITAFAVFFLLLGLGGFAWGATVPADLFGVPRGTAKPRFVRPGVSTGPVSYVVHCFAFSADRLLFAGTRLFQVEELFDNLRLRPARYVAVGVGRAVGGLESLVGLLLLVNFVQAVLRVI